VKRLQVAEIRNLAVAVCADLEEFVSQYYGLLRGKLRDVFSGSFVRLSELCQVVCLNRRGGGGGGGGGGKLGESVGVRKLKNF